MTSARTKSAAMLLLLGTLTSCAGALTSTALRELSDADLLAQSRRYVAVQNPAYRQLVVAELAHRHGWDLEAVEKVVSGTLWVGQTPEQLIASWGWPSTRSDSSNGYRTWRYRQYPPRRFVVTFRDDVVDSWTSHQ